MFAQKCGERYHKVSLKTKNAISDGGSAALVFTFIIIFCLNCLHCIHRSLSFYTIQTAKTLLEQ